jgi:hypothetical protein
MSGTSPLRGKENDSEVETPLDGRHTTHTARPSQVSIEGSQTRVLSRGDHGNAGTYHTGWVSGTDTSLVMIFDVTISSPMPESYVYRQPHSCELS